MNDKSHEDNPSTEPKPSDLPLQLNMLLRQKAQEQAQEKLPEQTEGKSIDTLIASIQKETESDTEPTTVSEDDTPATEGDETLDVPPSPESVAKTRDELERARRRQMAFLEKRREQKKRKVFYQRLKHLAGIVFFLLFSAAIWLLVDSPLWILNGGNFELSNNQLISAKHLRPIIAAYHHWPIEQVDPAEIENRIKQQYALVDEVYVRRALFPARLSVYVIEKTPFAELYHTPNSQVPYALATRNHINNQNDPRHSIIPLSLYRYKPNSNPNSVRIIIPSPVAKHTTLDLERLDHVTRQLQQVSDLHLQAIHLTPTTSSKTVNSLTAQFAETTVLIGLLDAEVTQRTERLTTLSPKILEMQKEIKAVDLRWSEQVTFVKNDGKPDIYFETLEKPKKPTPTVPASALTSQPRKSPPDDQAAQH